MADFAVRAPQVFVVPVPVYTAIPAVTGGWDAVLNIDAVSDIDTISAAFLAKAGAPYPVLARPSLTVSAP